jgi:hypothetical protein
MPFALPKIEAIAPVRARLTKEFGHRHRTLIILGIEVVAADDCRLAEEVDAIGIHGWRALSFVTNLHGNTKATDACCEALPMVPLTGYV